MKAIITIEMDNAAFDPFPQSELARILRELAHEVASEEDISPALTHYLRDENGNRVGQMEVKP